MMKLKFIANEMSHNRDVCFIFFETIFNSLPPPYTKKTQTNPKNNLLIQDL